jgi:hypothetical protein
MGAIPSSETLVLTRAKRRNIPGDVKTWYLTVALIFTIILHNSFDFLLNANMIMNNNNTFKFLYISDFRRRVSHNAQAKFPDYVRRETLKKYVPQLAERLSKPRYLIKIQKRS